MLLAVLVFAPTALAFESETTSRPTGRACITCHDGSVTASGTVSPTRKGPHGGYTTGTDKCESCHPQHEPVLDAQLQPARTIADTCEMCHDGTGGKGVYGAIEARTGEKPKSAHRIDTTNVVPSGSRSGETTMSFSGENGYLTCSDCHSPHDTDTVEPFIGDRIRAESDTPTSAATSRLLKRRPGNGEVAVDVYGSDWCAACHQGSVGTTALAGRMGDHSVATDDSGLSYGKVVRVTGVDTLKTESGALGGSNFGYVMPDPRAEDQDGHSPICQQCHEDARHVGDNLDAQFQIGTDEVFRVTAPDGQSAEDNPRFQVFPHESEMDGFVIESGDDLCLNCHPKD